jgi:hypothetical protein
MTIEVAHNPRNTAPTRRSCSLRRGSPRRHRRTRRWTGESRNSSGARRWGQRHARHRPQATDSPLCGPNTPRPGGVAASPLGVDALFGHWPASSIRAMEAQWHRCRTLAVRAGRRQVARRLPRCPSRRHHLPQIGVHHCRPESDHPSMLAQPGPATAAPGVAFIGAGLPPTDTVLPGVWVMPLCDG